MFYRYLDNLVNFSNFYLCHNYKNLAYIAFINFVYEELTQIKRAKFV